MANLIRSAKSSNDWTFYDLLAYNITVVPLAPEQFFPQNPGPLLEGLDPSLLNSSLDDKNFSDPNISDAVFRYLGYLGLATNPTQESFMDTFALETLHILGFSKRLWLGTHHSIPLSICGDVCQVAQTDVCLRDLQSTVLLVLRVDKSAFNACQPEPEVIAGAIAAYQNNNQRRLLRALSPLDAMTIPCITMVGTRPTFYLVPVTKALSTAVETGQYPEVQTTVMMCGTSLGHNSSLSEGMETPEYRRIAFEHFLAFKALAKEH
ncbi:uncharacterized protein F5147DRAFT_797075 [Suillus discolor]|uniref:Uncharacterized protein n=1 Tax=Suillus discolor TaxID=1912936 RepID=A0A9P7FAP9_9AGAM|nr:uncharacterized protein F5147DRAFT_797075 [Suillus discolor]KAG2110316.1 hypothetical protein F5147DRAFT_797075 [Suillus discolor]